MSPEDWVRAVAIAGGAVVAGWALLAVMARRLPPGRMRDVAAFLPDCVTLVRRLWRHPSVPRRTRLVLALAGLWVLSPIDLVPEFLPVVGPLDDAVVVALALRYAARRVPGDVLRAAWPGSDLMLARLVGRGLSGSSGARCEMP